jgi:UDP-glucose:(heptosyl)LPS alpha-1,3-glucosyltransferase
VLLFVGSGFERKGLRFCIEALAWLPTNFRLKVVGKGDVAAHQRLARRLGVASRLEFCGFNLDPVAVYQGADVLVHPAIYEPFANVCLEALASGLPVVTSRINGASEVLAPGVNGAIIERPDDIRELSAAIGQFQDPDRLAAASRQARTTAEAHPFARNVAATLDVLFRARTERAPTHAAVQ